MKARPRRAENRIADELNKWFTKYGLSPIERIPVLGRAGPDYTKNELQLNLDAKSRKSIPTSYKIKSNEVLRFENYWGLSLCNLNALGWAMDNWWVEVKPSVVIVRWIKHMGPNGGVILHWPGTPFKNAVLCLHAETILHARRVIDALK